MIVAQPTVADLIFSHATAVNTDVAGQTFGIVRRTGRQPKIRPAFSVRPRGNF
jgi:hypothetical protein